MRMAGKSLILSLSLLAFSTGSSFVKHAEEGEEPVAPAVPAAAAPEYDDSQPFLDIEEIAETGDIMTREGPLEDLVIPPVPVEEPKDVEISAMRKLSAGGIFIGFWASVVSLIWVFNQKDEEQEKVDNKDERREFERGHKDIPNEPQPPQREQYQQIPHDDVELPKFREDEDVWDDYASRAEHSDQIEEEVRGGILEEPDLNATDDEDNWSRRQ